MRQELHVILDNSSTHKTPAVAAWLRQHPRVHFHFTPKGASWLNLSSLVSILTRKSIRRGSFDTVRALIRHIERYLAEWNAHPTPCVDQRTSDIIRKPSGVLVNMTFADATLVASGRCDRDGGSAVRAGRQGATATIPIVMATSPDAVPAVRVVASFATPGEHHRPVHFRQELAGNGWSS